MVEVFTLLCYNNTGLLYTVARLVRNTRGIIGRDSENMNYKIAICDDSDTDRQYIAGLADRWAANTGHTVQISTFVSAGSFLFHYAERNDYDILLLDIEMGTMDGVTMAKKLRQENDAVQTVFITGYSDYILEGYEVAALHYLMKPVKAEKLFRSTKGEGHGFGLVRIDAIVERLDGYISRNSEDGAFTTEILLPQV